MTERLGAALGEKLLGVYLHGSAVLCDFRRERSDIDLVAVSDGPLTARETDELARTLSSTSLPCPAGGLELHVVDRGTLAQLPDRPPFELHIATAGSAGPDRVVVGPQSGDADLVMHFAVLREHGLALAGPPPAATFPSVPRARLLRAFAGELHWALKHGSPAYQVLNACRAWRFLEENVLTSKLAGAEWARARAHDPAAIDAAIEHRRTESAAQPDRLQAAELVEAVVRRLERRT